MENDMNNLITNKIVCNDAINFLNTIPNNSIDLIFVDPPYNKGKNYGKNVNDSMSDDEYFKWIDEWTSLAFNKLKKTGSFYHMNAQGSIHQVKLITDRYGCYKSTIVWLLRNPTPNKKNYPNVHQDVLFYTKDKNNYTFNQQDKLPYELRGYNKTSGITHNWHIPYNVWLDIPQLVGGFQAQKEVELIKRTFKRKHIMQLPLKLLERIILTSSNKEDSVLDFFCGSGTTCVAAKKLERKFVGVDINSDYCKLSNERLEKIKYYEGRKKINNYF